MACRAIPCVRMFDRPWVARQSPLRESHVNGICTLNEGYDLCKVWLVRVLVAWSRVVRLVVTLRGGLGRVSIGI